MKANVQKITSLHDILEKKSDEQSAACVALAPADIPVLLLNFMKPGGPVSVGLLAKPCAPTLSERTGPGKALRRQRVAGL